MEKKTLNPEQLAAINHIDGPILVVAGAGTGKTHVITRRIATLIKAHSVKPEEILALTFTDKAAREMEERVDQILPLGVNTVNITTFNSFGSSVLQEYGIDIGLSLGMRLISKTQQIVLLRDHIDELGLDYFSLRGNPSSLFGEWLNYFSSLRNELITPEMYQEHARNSKSKATSAEDKLEATKNMELANAYAAYTKIKQQKGLIDYDDQINLVIELLEKRPNVAEALRQRYKYVLVDEFQDTNLAQNKLIELLATKTGNIMVVGDDDQSIYKFRGAAISNILAFSEKYKDVKQVVLTHNYRSTRQILDAAYQLIQYNNPDRLEAKYNIDKRLVSSVAGSDPELISEQTIHSEAEEIAKHIKQHLNMGIDPSEIAVLVRKHRQLEYLVPALQKAEVPFSLNIAQKLYQQPEIQLLLSFLQFLVDPHQSEALYYLMQNPHFGFDHTVLASHAAKARSMNEPLFSYLTDHVSEESILHADFIDFYQLIAEIRKYSASHGVVETVYEFLVRSGYKDKLEEQAEDDPSLVTVFKNLEQYLQILSEFEEVAEDKSARGYVQSLGALRDLWQAESYQDPDFGQGQIKLMTIHQSKGLEFEVVYIFDVNQSDFPGANRGQALKIPDELLKEEVLSEGNWHLQEERRLMYVAATRAKSELVLSFSPDHGGKQQRRPSVFLKEIFGEGATAPKESTAQLTLGLDRFAPVGVQTAALHQQLITPEGKLRLTPHQIDDYFTCPLNFKHRYLLHVPEAPSAALMYGNVLHKIINQYYVLRAKGDVQLTDLSGMLDQLWESQGFESKQQEEMRKQLAREAVQNFYKNQEERGELPILTEERLEFEIPEANVVVSGRFDAIFQDPDGSTEIRDFKTSYVDDADKAEDKAKKSVQLAIYALAWQYRTGKAPDRVALDYVNTGQVGVAVKTDKQLELLKEKIIAAAKGIRAEQFPPQGNHMYCSHRPIAGAVHA